MLITKATFRTNKGNDPLPFVLLELSNGQLAEIDLYSKLNLLELGYVSVIADGLPLETITYPDGSTATAYGIIRDKQAADALKVFADAESRNNLADGQVIYQLTPN